MGGGVSKELQDEVEMALSEAVSACAQTGAIDPVKFVGEYLRSGQAETDDGPVPDSAEDTAWCTRLQHSIEEAVNDIINDHHARNLPEGGATSTIRAIGEHMVKAATFASGELPSTDTAGQKLTADPRWDRTAFEQFVARSAPFLTLGYLKRVAAAGVPAGRESVPPAELHFSLPTDAGVVGRKILAVLSPCLLVLPHPDPASELRDILKYVAYDYADDDFIFWDHLCAAREDQRARDGVFRLFTHYRVQTVVMIERYGHPRTVFDQLETMAMLALVAFCQRLVNASDPAVNAMIDLAHMMDLPNQLAVLHCTSQHEFIRVTSKLETIIRALKPVATDAVGFGVLLEEAHLTWLRVSYVRELAGRAGPCPRNQELDPAGIIVGRRPKGRMFAVSHGWDAQLHISPTNDKLRRLAAQLDLLDAHADEDAVFLE
jgi:hypothetical protein